MQQYLGAVKALSQNTKAIDALICNMAVHSISSRVRDFVKYFGVYNENRHLLLLVLPHEQSVLFPVMIII